MGDSSLVQVLNRLKYAISDATVDRRALWALTASMRSDIRDLANAVQGSQRFTLQEIEVELSQAEHDDAKMGRFVTFLAIDAAWIDRLIAAGGSGDSAAFALDLVSESNE